MKAHKMQKLEKRIERRAMHLQKKQAEFREWARANYSHGETLHLTMTFSPKCYDIAIANKTWRELRRKLNIKSFMHVIESHVLGGYHIHAIIFDKHFIPISQIIELWGAYASISKVSSLDKLLEYLVPYLKSTPGTYAYYRSRNLVNPCVFDAWTIFGKEFVKLKAR